MLRIFTVNRKLVFRKYALFIIIFLFIGLTIWGVIHYYAPVPPLNKVRSDVYKQIIDFAKKHKSWGDFTLGPDDRIVIPNPKLTNSEIQSIMDNPDPRIKKWLLQSSTMMVFRRHDMIFFRIEPQF